MKLRGWIGEGTQFQFNFLLFNSKFIVENDSFFITDVEDSGQVMVAAKKPG